MKKKILLKSLVAVTPLVGVVAPLASCTTTETNESLNTILKNDSTTKYCPVVAEDIGSYAVKADKPLPIPETPKFTGEDVHLYCENPLYFVQSIESIIAVRNDGHRENLIVNRDYTFEALSEGFSTIHFTTDYMSTKIYEQNPTCVVVVPKQITCISYEVTVESSPIVKCNLDKISNITAGFEATFEIESTYAKEYQFTHETVANFKMKIGKGLLTSEYIEVDSEQYDVELVEGPQSQPNIVKLTLKPGLDLSKFDPESNNVVFDVPFYGENELGSTITLFDNTEIVRYSHSLVRGQEGFSLAMLPYHGKKPIKAKWKFGAPNDDWTECVIKPDAESDDRWIIESSDKTPITSDIVIVIEAFSPLEKQNAFENETWDDLGFWTNHVYNLDISDDQKGEKLAQIYGLNSNDEFLGKTKKVTWKGIENKVMVASTFQLKKVKANAINNMVLDEEDVDFDHHAAFTFQFANLLTGFDDEGKPYVAKNRFDKNCDGDANCWVESAEYIWSDDWYSSDIRNFLHDDFPNQVSENLKGVVTPTATSHWIISDPARTKGYKEIDCRYICDTFAMPTAYQMNSTYHRPPTPHASTNVETNPVSNATWYVEYNCEEPYEIFKNETQTDEECPYRQFKPAPCGVELETISYWLCSPCEYDSPFLWDYDNDVYVNPDGSLHNKDCDKRSGLLPCFSI